MHVTLRVSTLQDQSLRCAHDAGEPLVKLSEQSDFMLEDDIASDFAIKEPLIVGGLTIKCAQFLFGIEKLNVPRSKIPAVTHVDYSARLQTVDRQTNPRFHALLSRFKARTGCPVLVNTSFNVRGEPIVCTPEDAFRCFMGTRIDCLAVGDCLLRKEEQDPALQSEYACTMAPD